MTLTCGAVWGMQEPGHQAPVIVAGKDQGEVDNDYLLIPVNILDHEGALGAAFPVENRLLPQGALCYFWSVRMWLLLLASVCMRIVRGYCAPAKALGQRRRLLHAWVAALCRPSSLCRLRAPRRVL
jgi:hypothetical protein